MKFNILDVHTVYESGSVNKSITGLNEDNNINENMNPIPEFVFNSMRESAANPDNLKITATNGENPKLYIEAFEFFTYCEASGKTFNEAADEILKTAGDNPELENAEFHVVFPSDCMNKNILGGENLGRNIKNDWAMQLIRGCRRYGLKVNIGKESDYPTGGNEEDKKDEQNDEKKEPVKEGIENIIGQIDNLVDKSSKKINKEIEKRKAMIEEFNKKKKKEKEKKYKDIK